MNNDNCLSVCPDIRELSSSSLIPLAVAELVLIPVTILSNTMVLIALIRTKSIGLASQSFAVALCINDLLIGVFLQPIAAAYILSSTLQGLCKVRWTIQSLSYSLLVLDMLIICSMAIERLIVLKYALSNVLLRWKAIKKYVLVFDAVFAIAFSAASVLIAKYSNHFYHLFSFASQILAFSIFLVTVIAYILAYRHVRRSVSKISNEENSNVHFRNKSLRHDVALGRSVVMILATCFVLYMPLAASEIIWTLYLYDQEISISQKTVKLFLSWSFVPLFINSSANVFIYSYFNRPVRRYIVKRIPRLCKICLILRDPTDMSVDTKL